MLLAVAKRGNEDERTLGELFNLMVSEVADLSFKGHAADCLCHVGCHRRYVQVDGYAGKFVAEVFLGQFARTITVQPPATLGCIGFFCLWIDIFRGR